MGSRIAGRVFGGFLLLGGTLSAAAASKPKEIVVVGSKLSIHAGSVGRYYLTAAKHEASRGPTQGGRRLAPYTLVDTVLLGPADRPGALEMELLAAGRRVAKSKAELRCEPRGETAAARPPYALLVADLGFSLDTPVVVSARGATDEIRIGPAWGKAGRCTAIGLLVPAVQAARSAASRTP